MGAMGGMGLESAYAPLMSPPHSALSNDDYSNGAALPQVAHSDACQSTSQAAQASCASSSYAARSCEGLDGMVGMATDGEMDDMTRHAWSPPPPPAGAHGEARGSPFEATAARCKRDRDRDRKAARAAALRGVSADAASAVRCAPQDGMFEQDRRRIEQRDFELRQAMVMSATMSLPAAPPLAARSPSRKRLHSEDDDSC